LLRNYAARRGARGATNPGSSDKDTVADAACPRSALWGHEEFREERSAIVDDTQQRPGILRGDPAWAGQAPPGSRFVPVDFTTFPGEIFAAPRSWVETVYPNLTYFNEVDKGGHFPAWEEPELFATEIRAAFGPLR
jgi:pimeloyl-ACP methyl ester carboxylesterase